MGDERDLSYYKLLPRQSGACVCRRDNLTGNLIPALLHNTRRRMIHSASLKHKSVYREPRMDFEWEVADLVGERNPGFYSVSCGISMFEIFK